MPATPATTNPVTTPQTAITTEPAGGSGEGTVVLQDKEQLTMDEYKEYKFSDMGYEFLYEGDTFKVYITSEKPVLVYCVDYMDAIRLEAPSNTPRYESYSDEVQWGAVEPAFFMERATHATGTFTIQEVGRYSFIVDPRWMTFDSAWSSKYPFAYEITIMKV